MTDNSKIIGPSRELDRDELTTTDRLTGAFNHRHFHELLGQIGKVGGPISLLMVDVDRFKSFNDAFGHPAGDLVLQKVAQALRSAARKTDVVVRYGGEEFAVLMSDSDADPALALGERIRQAVESIDLLPRRISVSVGVSTLVVAGKKMGRLLLEQAEVALYAAKAAGRNRVVHHRHVRANRQGSTSIQPCKTQCAPSPTGCLRCESIPGVTEGSPSALLLGAAGCRRGSDDSPGA